MKKRLHQLSLPGYIWRIHFDPCQQAMVIEVRDTDKQELQLFVCQLASPALQSLLFDLPDPRWMQPYAAWDGQVIIQGYGTPDLPLSQGIYVYRVSDGLLQWQDPVRKADGLSTKGILSRHPQLPQRREMLDWKTGNVEELALSTWETYRSEGEKKLFGAITYATSVLVASPQATTYVEQRSLGTELIWELHHLTLSDQAYDVLSWYVPVSQGSPQARQHLGIWQHGKPLYQAVIHQQVDRPTLDPFLLYGSYLIWYDDQSRLFVMDTSL